MTPTQNFPMASYMLRVKVKVTQIPVWLYFLVTLQLQQKILHILAPLYSHYLSKSPPLVLTLWQPLLPPPQSPRVCCYLCPGTDWASLIISPGSCSSFIFLLGTSLATLNCKPAKPQNSIILIFFFSKTFISIL